MGWGGAVRPHSVKSQHDLPPAAGPAAVLGDRILTDIERVPNSGAICGQAEGEHPMGRIRGRSMPLPGARRIEVLAPRLGGQGHQQASNTKRDLDERAHDR